MNLKMQMRPRRAAGVADVGNDLPGFDLLACGDADARAVRVQCRQSTAVVELDVVAITAAPTVEGVGDSDGAVGSRQDRGAFGHSDVGAAVVAGFASDRVGAVALRRGDRARHRQRPLQRAATQFPHTLLKVSDICGLTGEIGFHDTDTGYLVSFPDDDGKADQRMAEYKKRLIDLENNIWNR